MGLLQKIGFWFKGCAVCHASLPPTWWLCHSCFQRLKSYYLKPQDMIRWQNGFTHIRLLDWNAKNDYFVRAVINSLKSRKQVYIFDELMKELFYRTLQISPYLWSRSNINSLSVSIGSAFDFKANLFLNKNYHFLRKTLNPCNLPIIIPAPPGRKGFKDHAFYLGQSLSLLSGYQFLPLLSRLDSTFNQQKQKSKPHRRQLRFQLNNYISHLNSVIFVDDVLTTGSTAVAAKKVLNPSKNFIVLTIAWRHLI